MLGRRRGLEKLDAWKMWAREVGCLEDVGRTRRMWSRYGVQEE
jgi:hypothetical protein